MTVRKVDTSENIADLATKYLHPLQYNILRIAAGEGLKHEFFGLEINNVCVKDMSSNNDQSPPTTESIVLITEIPKDTQVNANDLWTEVLNLHKAV